MSGQQPLSRRQRLLMQQRQMQQQQQSPQQRQMHQRRPHQQQRYAAPFDTTCEERHPDIKEMLKTEVGRVGEQDVAYRLHRGDASVADRDRDAVTDTEDDPLVHSLRRGSIYTPPAAALSEIPRPAVFQPTPTARATREMIGISDIYVEFDSFEKMQPSAPEEGLLVFDARSANDENPIDNIIEMQIYPFYMPEIKTDVLYQPNYYYYRRITMAIQNIGGIQFVKKTVGSNNWHFELEAENAGSMFRMEPNTHDGKYVFTKPVHDVSVAEFRFRVPDSTINLPIDTYAGTVVNPADFGPGGNQRIETAIPHGLTVGGQTTVFIKKFNSNNSIFNTAMNSTIGHVVDVVSSTKLQFTNTPTSTLLGTSVDANGDPTTATVCIGERRIRFIVRFRRILPTLTNWISP